MLLAPVSSPDWYCKCATHYIEIPKITNSHLSKRDFRNYTDVNILSPEIFKPIQEKLCNIQTDAPPKTKRTIKTKTTNTFLLLMGSKSFT